MLIQIPRSSNPSDAKMATWLSELQAATAITKERQRGHWIDFHSDELRRLLGGRYRQVVTESMRLGLVEVNERYAVNRFTKSYRLANRHRISATKTYSVKRKSGAKIRLADDDVVGRQLVRWFDHADCPKVSHGWAGYATNSIRSGAWYATRCRYGRFHTSFTGLPRAIRQRLRLAGEPVAELDVANCQAIFVGLLEREQQHQTTDNNNTNTTPNPYVAQNEFLRIAEQGLIYQAMLDSMQGLTLFDSIPKRYRHPHGKDRPVNLQDVKRQFIVMLFADVALMIRLPVWERFSARFSSTARFIENYKSQHGYQALARDCQRLESRLMIDTAAASIDGPVVTVHDSIVCRASQRDQVAAAISQAFADRGLSVRIKD